MGGIQFQDGTIRIGQISRAIALGKSMSAMPTWARPSRSCPLGRGTKPYKSPL
ncbi:hypothetical protein LC605_26415 [Nostoc sp. CHAB 5836]|uniref:hypothetical protein n=1 Tax=Nostoc sp. CHAB 5836 TaxID=2780404 RepID=UPI001E30565C|nr:hypothetical protein [Nostoc sp. CHAB 5836]MCC5618557.1 hypothetical protein [Nostoc sp. CHAB 5836]